MDGKIHSAISYLKHRLLAGSGGHGVHSPFAYSLCENVFYNRSSYYGFRRLEEIRQQLLTNENPINAGKFGAGSRTFPGSIRRVKHIAQHGISPARQSQQLFRLANVMGATTCIELGTSLGLNTLYLALQNTSGKVITVEGSAALHAFAKDLARTNGASNVEFIHAPFNEALPKIVDELAELPLSQVTLAYIDGDHSFAPTMDYFETLLPLARGNNVFVFDDIYWSKAMTKAWKLIQAHPAVRMSIDTFYAGFVFFNPDIRQKVSLRLSV